MMKGAGIESLIQALGRVFHVNTVLVAGTLLLVASGVLGWIDRPVLGWLIGFKMPLSEKLPGVISYGLFCSCAGAASLLAISNRFRWAAVLGGGAALLLCVHFLLAYSILNAKDIILVNEFNQQQARMVLFNNRNLPTCFMINPTFDPAISTDTISDRLYATIHFSTFGWYSAALGSILILLAFFKRDKNIRIAITSFIAGLLIIILYIIITTLPFALAEYYRSKGDYYFGSGMYSNALNEYYKYIIIDNSSNYIKSFHNHIGKIYYFTGKQDLADSYIYKGSMYLEQNNYQMAIFCYKNANDDKLSSMSPAGISFLVYTYIKDGLNKYQNNMKWAAIEAWKEALKINPLQIEAYYYLSRAYYDVSSYEESVTAGLQFMKYSRDRIRNAEMSCNVADSLHKMKKYDQARESYLKSLDLVVDGNQRALMSLVGR